MAGEGVDDAAEKVDAAVNINMAVSDTYIVKAAIAKDNIQLLIAALTMYQTFSFKHNTACAFL